MDKWKNICHQLAIPTPFSIGDVHVYLLKGDRLTLVDTGPKTAVAKDALEHGLMQLGYRVQDIEQVVITHHHVDHAGLANIFGDQIDFVGHQDCSRWVYRTEDFVQESNQFYQQLAATSGVPERLQNFHEFINADKMMGCRRHLTITIEAGESIPGHPDWVAIETNGHSQGHLSYYCQPEKLLLGGDVLLSQTTSSPIIEPPLQKGIPRTRALLQQIASFQKLREMEIDMLLPSHEDNVSDVKSLLEQRFHEQQYRSEKCLHIVNDKPQTVYEICSTIFPKRAEKLLPLILFETIGQLDYLLSRGAITEVEEQNVFFYRKS